MVLVCVCRLGALCAAASRLPTGSSALVRTGDTSLRQFPGHCRYDTADCEVSHDGFAAGVETFESTQVVVGWTRSTLPRRPASDGGVRFQRGEPCEKSDDFRACSFRAMAIVSTAKPAMASTPTPESSCRASKPARRRRRDTCVHAAAFRNSAAVCHVPSRRTLRVSCCCAVPPCGVAAIWSRRWR